MRRTRRPPSRSGPLRRWVVAVVLAVGLGSGMTACTGDVPAVLPLGPAGTAPAGVVVVGDSITAGHGLPVRDAWPRLLAARDGVRVTDLGCDGAGVLAEGSDQCASTYDGLAERAAALHPAVVLVQASSNDLGQDDDELDGASVQLVTELRRLLPTARIVGLSAIWSEHAPPAQLAAVSAALHAAVRQVGGTWADLGQPMRGHRGLLQSDDVHPTARGQRAVLAAVVAALRRDHLRV